MKCIETRASEPASEKENEIVCNCAWICNRKIENQVNVLSFIYLNTAQLNCCIDSINQLACLCKRALTIGCVCSPQSNLFVQHLNLKNYWQSLVSHSILLWIISVSSVNWNLYMKRKTTWKTTSNKTIIKKNQPRI